MSQTDPTVLRKRSARTTALLVIGLLILVPSGLCTGMFGGSALIEMLSHRRGEDYASGILVLAIAIGTPFIALGSALVWWAVRRMRAVSSPGRPT